MATEIQGALCPRCGEWIESRAPLMVQSMADPNSLICFPCHKMEDIEKATSVGVRPKDKWRFPGLHIIHTA